MNIYNIFVAGVEGKTAKLTCTVRSRGDRFVSWIRRGVHPVVLSSGDVTFTSDTRYYLNRHFI